MGKFKGTQLIFNADASALTFSKSFDYTLNGNLVETTSMEDGDFASFMPVGGKSINGSVEYFVVSTSDSSRNVAYLSNAFMNNASIGFQFVATGLQTVSGACYVNDLKFSNPGPKDVVTGSCSFQSTGKFTIL